MRQIYQPNLPSLRNFVRQISSRPLLILLLLKRHECSVSNLHYQYVSNHIYNLMSFPFATTPLSLIIWLLLTVCLDESVNTCSSSATSNIARFAIPPSPSSANVGLLITP